MLFDWTNSFSLFFLSWLSQNGEYLKCLVGLMQEKSLWGSLFYTQFSGSQGWHISAYFNREMLNISPMASSPASSRGMLRHSWAGPHPFLKNPSGLSIPADSCTVTDAADFMFMSNVVILAFRPLQKQYFLLCICSFQPQTIMHLLFFHHELWGQSFLSFSLNLYFFSFSLWP